MRYLQLIALVAAVALTPLITATSASTTDPSPVLTCPRVELPVTVDGRLQEPAWKDAFASGDFMQIENGERAHHGTRAHFMYDDEYLYIGVGLRELNVRAKLKDRGANIHSENDVEVLIEGENGYYRLAMNALGTVSEAMWVQNGAGEQHIQNALLQAPEQAGIRLSSSAGHNLPGLETAVFVNGTINYALDVDQGWSAEIALSWKRLSAITGRAMPPSPGETLQLSVLRFQWYDEVGKQYPHPHALGLSLHGREGGQMFERLPVMEFRG